MFGNKLQQISTWTGYDARYIIVNTGWLGLGRILGIGLSLFSTFLFARILSRESFGEYRYALSQIALLSIFCLPGINTILLSYVSKGRIPSIKKVVFYKIAWGLITSFALLMTGIYWLFIYPNSLLGWSFMLTAVLAPLHEAVGIYEVYLHGRADFKSLSKQSLLTQLFSSVCTAIVLLNTQNIVLILATFFGSTIFIKLFFLRGLSRTVQDTNLTREEEKDLFSYGRHISFVGGLGLLVDQLDKLVLFHFLGGESLAVYSMAMNPVEQVKSLSQSAQTIAIPKLAHRTAHDIQKKTKKELLLVFVISTAVALLYAGLSRPAFSFFFPQYIDAVGISALYALSIPLTLLNDYLGSLRLVYLDHIPKHYLYLWKIQSIFSLGITVLFILYGHLFGAILAKLLSQFLNLALGTFIWRKTFQLFLAKRSSSSPLVT